MVDQKQLGLLKSSVEAWNKWKLKNYRVKIDLIGANLEEANLQRANLRGADLQGVNLQRANLQRANLQGANLQEANLEGADLEGAYLEEAYLRGAKLQEAKLQEAKLFLANLQKAKLQEAYLTTTQALKTNFQNANLTGACIEDWNINSETQFDGVICEYIYLKQEYQNDQVIFSERRPHDPNKNFAPGEFTKIFQKSLETVDLIFREGLNWKAFAYSFKKVEVENEKAQLAISSIENKGDGVVLVRVKTAPDANKGKIHGDFMEGYEFAKKELIPQYEARLEDKGKIINQLIRMTETPKYSFTNSPIGNVVDTAQSGSQLKAQVNQHNYAPEQQQNLTEAAAEIQILLDQLSKTYSPTTTANNLQIATKTIEALENNPL